MPSRTKTGIFDNEASAVDLKVYDTLNGPRAPAPRACLTQPRATPWESRLNTDHNPERGCLVCASRVAAIPHQTTPSGLRIHRPSYPRALPWARIGRSVGAGRRADGFGIGTCANHPHTDSTIPERFSILHAMPQSLSKVYLHIVFSTKNREPWLRPEIRAEVHRYLGGVAGHHDCPAIIVSGVADHVHLLCVLGRTITQADLLMEIKRGSSRWIKERFEGVHGFAWQNGYGAFSIGQSQVEQVTRYIEKQEEHHRRKPDSRATSFSITSHPSKPAHSAKSKMHSLRTSLHKGAWTLTPSLPTQSMPA